MADRNWMWQGCANHTENWTRVGGLVGGIGAEKSRMHLGKRKKLDGLLGARWVAMGQIEGKKGYIEVLTMVSKITKVNGTHYSKFNSFCLGTLEKLLWFLFSCSFCCCCCCCPFFLFFWLLSWKVILRIRDLRPYTRIRWCQASSGHQIV